VPDQVWWNLNKTKLCKFIFHICYQYSLHNNEKNDKHYYNSYKTKKHSHVTISQYKPLLCRQLCQYYMVCRWIRHPTYTGWLHTWLLECCAHIYIGKNHSLRVRFLFASQYFLDRFQSDKEHRTHVKTFSSTFNLQYQWAVVFSNIQKHFKQNLSLNVWENGSRFILEVKCRWKCFLAGVRCSLFDQHRSRNY
jgi:hypothetical protein